ncbi:cytochrome c biogenesis protein ResB [Canibacter sp. lx-45]|nr:cytochrome c biogenesis protein ResB [Canibacter zhuwentaonis]
MSRPHDYDDGSPAAARRETAPRPLGFVGWARWAWRGLSSMKVALVLLLLLAIAAIPGSLVPQRGADPNGVAQFRSDHPELFKVLDAFPIQAFDVYASVWFSAIYLLLFISLIACITPRTLHHLRALRADPPLTPSRLNRMVGFTELRLSNSAASAAVVQQKAREIIAHAKSLLKKQGYRVVVRERGRGVRCAGELSDAAEQSLGELSVAAERGYLRETGNLLFHAGLVGVLVFVAVGSGVKFNGQKALHEGETMVNALIDYDSANSGRYFDPQTLDPFRVRLDKFEVDYVRPDEGDRSSIGFAKDYRAKVTVVDRDGSSRQETIRVNHPLRVNNTHLYLTANGYAPRIVVRDAEGKIVFAENVLFIPQDQNLTSLGVVKVPHGLSYDGSATQLGLRGFFYPTKVDTSLGAFTSAYPDLENPLLTLDVFVGDLGINEGIPKSVYALDVAKMQQLAGRGVDQPALQLKIGQTAQLPQQMGTVTLEAAPRYAAFEIMRDPTAVGVLGSSVIAIGGLVVSLFVPRRRMWVKTVVCDDGTLAVQYAGLARGDDPTLESAVAQLVAKHRYCF